MATGITNLTTFDALLKEHYLGPIRDQINSKDTVYGMLNKRDQMDGEYLVIPLRTGRSFSFGFQAAAGVLPPPQTQRYNKALVYPKYFYGTLEVSQEVIEQSRTGRGAFARAVRTQLEGLPLDMRDDLDRCILSDGSASLALFDGPTDVDLVNDRITLNDPEDARKFGPGQLIEAWSSAANGATQLNYGGSAGTQILTVDSVDLSAGTVDFVENILTAGTLDSTGSNKSLAKAGARLASLSYECMGLNGIISASNRAVSDSGGANLQGIPVSNQYWTSYIDSAGSNRPVTTRMLQKLIDGAKIRGNGTIHYFVAPYGVRMEYAETQLNVRRNVNTIAIAGQTSGGFRENEDAKDFIEYGGLGWIPDKYAPQNTLFACDWDSLYVARFADFDWLDTDGSILKWNAGSRTPTFEAIMYCYLELVTNARNRSAKATQVIGDDPA